MPDHHKRRREDRSHGQRSRSPARQQKIRCRSRSPYPQSDQRKRKHSSAAAPATLPFQARELTKRDYQQFKPMFGSYLDIQKGKILEEMDDREARGRWKSFVGKWNRGELSEGWYHPSTLEKALAVVSTMTDSTPIDARNFFPGSSKRETFDPSNDSDSDRSIGPSLPGLETHGRSARMGPSIPNIQDLEVKKEIEFEDRLARRDDLRLARKAERKEQRSALEELVPRAEAGTRERQLEKKKELNQRLSSFRERSPGTNEVPDSQLMGGGDGLDSYKRQKQEFERKKNQRELRKEEILRARMAEREERLQDYRAKEEGTMAMLKTLAKQRFGSVSNK